MDNADEGLKGYITEGILLKTIKLCPHCFAFGELDTGCNYIKCPLCTGEWCWVCNNPKYKPIPNRENSVACNDKSHNSH